MSGGPVFEYQTTPTAVTEPRRVIQEGREGPVWRASIEARVAALEVQTWGHRVEIGPPACEADQAARFDAVLTALEDDGEVQALKGKHQFDAMPDQGTVRLTYLGRMSWTLGLTEAAQLAAGIRKAVAQVQAATVGTGRPPIEVLGVERAGGPG